MYRTLIYLIALTLSGGSGGASAPGSGTTPVADPTATIADELLPTRAGIRFGSLPNGLRYAVERNRSPADGIELRLVVEAGSLQDPDGQEGVAHFVEHLALRESQELGSGDLGSYFRSLDVQSGQEVGATTDYTDTTYRLRLHSSDVETLTRGLEILAEWAHGLDFPEAEVEAERPVVLEEWAGLRENRGLLDGHLDLLVEGLDSRRRPEGTREGLTAASPAALSAFYRQWYRADRIAVIVVGDIDPSVSATAIASTFGDLPQARSPEPDPMPIARRTDALVASVAQDASSDVAMVGVAFPHAAYPPRTVGEYRRLLSRFLFHRVLGERLEILAQGTSPPFLLARSSDVTLLPSVTATVAIALCEPGLQESALEALMREIERIVEHGVGPRELELHRAALLRDMDEAARGAARRGSSEDADELVRHFTAGEHIPGLEAEAELARRLLPAIGSRELREIARTEIPLDRSVLVLTRPASPAAGPEDDVENALLTTARSVLSEPTRPTPDRVADQLEIVPPMPGEIVATRRIPGIDTMEWTLANGMRVVAKIVDPGSGTIAFTSLRAAGYSGLPRSDRLAAWIAPKAVRVGGVGRYDAEALRGALAGRSIRVTPYVWESTAGLVGQASLADLTGAFQLIYLYSTSPRPDADAFSALRSRLGAALEREQEDPKAKLDAAERRLTMAETDQGPEAWPPEVAREVPLDAALTAYRRLVGNPTGRTFVFIGDLEIGRLANLVRTYLASLPAGSALDRKPAPGPRAPRERVEADLTAGTGELATVRIVFTGPLRGSSDDRLAVRALGAIFTDRLEADLRTDRSGVYSVRVDSETRAAPASWFRVRVQFDCAPERVDELAAATLAEARSLREMGASDEEIARWKRERIGELREARETVSYWLDALSTAYSREEDPAEIVRAEAAVRSVSAAAVREVAVHCLDPHRYVRLVRHPER